MKRGQLLGIVVFGFALIGCSEQEVVGDSAAAVNGRHPTPKAQAERRAMRERARAMDPTGERSEAR